MHDLELDVCVVGGGPAGALAAFRLATLGHRVCLLERQVFPRPQVGESLSPGIWPLLDSAGLGELISSTSFRAPGHTLLCWAESEPQLLPSDSRAGALLVDRGKFDALLLEAARQAGVYVVQPAQARVTRTPKGWQIFADGVGRFNISAKALVDAAGRKSCLGGRRVAFSPRTIALWAHLDANHDCATRVEAIPEGWLWAAPIADDKVSLLFFCDPSHIRRSSGGDLERLLRERMTKTVLFSGFAQATFSRSVAARDATCTYATEPIGADYIMIGEANYSLDPLSSTGVEKALQSALTGAAVVNTLINHPERSNLCTQFYRDRQHEVVNTHIVWMNQYYREVQRHAGKPFWNLRCASSIPRPNVLLSKRPKQPRLTTLVRLAPEVSLTREACVIDDEIARRPGIRAPSLVRPLVFLNGIEVGLLLADLAANATWQDLLVSWSRYIPPASAQRVAKWLWEKRILCEASLCADL
ncbi:MAG: tryptophan 7-halogenase [Verrucomicrobia bacterium]|nr:tryptophan 7-halogenase [Verrucomicrobiota bacterium]MBV8485620.1 tryptophan 7-halogenase [Verrucomicrobiota bacterium]